jgi:hypothetical protein
MVQSNVELARRGYEAALRGDLDTIREFLHPMSGGMVVIPRLLAPVAIASRHWSSCAARVAGEALASSWTSSTLARRLW